MSKSSVHEALLVLISQGIITRTEAGFVFVKSKLHEFVRPTGQEILSGPSDTLSGPPDKTVRPTGQANNTITKDRERNPKDIAFDSFWKVYPRKTGKGAAFASWKKKTPPLDKCLRTLSLLVQTDQWRREEGRFIPHPATWLNQERWDDVPEGYKEFTCCGCGYVGKVRSGYKGAAKCPECSATTMV